MLLCKCRCSVTNYHKLPLTKVSAYASKNLQAAITTSESELWIVIPFSRRLCRQINHRRKSSINWNIFKSPRNALLLGVRYIAKYMR